MPKNPFSAAGFTDEYAKRASICSFTFNKLCIHCQAKMGHIQIIMQIKASISSVKKQAQAPKGPYLSGVWGCYPQPFHDHFPTKK